MMIPAPDRFRCPARNPDGYGQCMLAEHGDDMRHRIEKPDVLRDGRTTTCYTWGPDLHADDFPEGPFELAPATITAADYEQRSSVDEHMDAWTDE